MFGLMYIIAMYPSYLHGRAGVPSFCACRLVEGGEGTACTLRPLQVSEKVLRVLYKTRITPKGGIWRKWVYFRPECWQRLLPALIEDYRSYMLGQDLERLLSWHNTHPYIKRTSKTKPPVQVPRLKLAPEQLAQRKKLMASWRYLHSRLVEKPERAPFINPKLEAIREQLVTLGGVPQVKGWR